MAQELIIECDGRLHHFSQLPVRIGRGQENELVILQAGVAESAVIIEAAENGALVARAEAECYLNGELLTAPRDLHAQDRLQLGLHTLVIWQTGREETTPPPAPQKNPAGWWRLFSCPFLVAGWFFAAVALPTWEGYLNSAQTYIPDYETPLVVTFWILALTFVIHAMVFPIARRYLIVPIIGVVSAFITVGTLADWLANWYGFQFNGAYGGALSAVGSFLFFVGLYRAFLRDFVPLSGRALRKTLCVTLVPIFLFSVYSYLKQNDYFKLRPGSYPAYHATLQDDVLFHNRIKSIDQFFMIDKNEHQE